MKNKLTEDDFDIIINAIKNSVPGELEQRTLSEEELIASVERLRDYWRKSKQ